MTALTGHQQLDDASSHAAAGGIHSGPIADKDSRVLRWITWVVIAVHLVPLLTALPNYRASVDSAYHTAIGRQYAVHGIYFWDNIHYAPAHRPNLQGPALHVAIGLLGRLLGGQGDHYVAANALLGIACWLSAVFTVIYFARRLSGDLAALLATAVLTGGANTGTSLSMNLPVFWMFIATGWSIYFFLQRRLGASLGFAALACYAHLGGFATVSVGLVVATCCRDDRANFRQRLREMVLVGLGTIIVTSPYWLHVLRSLSWYVGTKGDTAWWIDPLVALWWLIGIAVALRMPQRNGLLLAWAAAPAIWIFQDASRFILVSALPGAVLGSVAIAPWLNGLQQARTRRIVTGALVYVATAFPLGIPALGADILWLVRPFPIMLDWHEMRADAQVIRDLRLNDQIVQGYTSYVVSALSVYTDIEGEKGHWVEVQPPVDPSEDLGVAEKTYVVALPPGDEALAAWQASGWVDNYGGGEWSSVLRFKQRPSLEEATLTLHRTFAQEAAWLAEHGEHNSMGNFIAIVLDPEELPRRRAIRGESRARMSRMQIAMLLYAYALESSDSQLARLARDDARALGWIATLQGDEMAMDYRSTTVDAQFRRDPATLSVAATRGEQVPEKLNSVFEGYLSAARGGLFANKSKP